MVIFFSRKNCRQNFTLINDQEKIDQLEEMYNLNQDDIVLSQNKEYPVILGSITRNVVVSMMDVAQFNLYLDTKKIKRDLGDKGERVLDNMLKISQGIKGSSLGKQLKTATNTDWVVRFKENLPFPEKNILICGMPKTR